jgi:hypothetical protein
MDKTFWILFPSAVAYDNLPEKLSRNGIDGTDTLQIARFSFCVDMTDLPTGLQYMYLPLTWQGL